MSQTATPNNDILLECIDDILGEGGRNLDPKTAARLTLATTRDLHRVITEIKDDVKSMRSNPLIVFGQWAKDHQKVSMTLFVIAVVLLVTPNLPLLPVVWQWFAGALGLPVSFIP